MPESQLKYFLLDIEIDKIIEFDNSQVKTIYAGQNLYQMNIKNRTQNSRQHLKHSRHTTRENKHSGFAR